MDEELQAALDAFEDAAGAAAIAYDLYKRLTGREPDAGGELAPQLVPHEKRLAEARKALHDLIARRVG